MRERQDNDPLGAAVDAWREAEGRREPERLSEGMRSQIVDRALAAPRGGRSPILAGLFVPARRFVLAAALPAVVLAVGLGYLIGPGSETGRRQAIASGTVRAHKSGDDVVFVIANGNTVHRVMKTGTAGQLRGGAVSETTDGTYRDDLREGPALVFYRIE